MEETTHKEGRSRSQEERRDSADGKGGKWSKARSGSQVTFIGSGSREVWGRLGTTGPGTQREGEISNLCQRHHCPV